MTPVPGGGRQPTPLSAWELCRHKGHIGLFVFVSPEPSRPVVLHFLNTVKLMRTKPVVKDTGIIALDVSIFLWVAQLDNKRFDLEKMSNWQGSGSLKSR